MTDLTEQWKKGELKEGWYYTELWKGCNVIDKFIGNQFLRYDDSDIVEVITPVPSYEKWQTVFNYATKYEVEYVKCVNDYEELRKENQHLKELLKECKDIIEWYKADTGYVDLPTENILTRINAALGESEE